MPAERLILGIDPGSNVMGFGVLRVVPGARPLFVDMDIIDLRKEKDTYETMRQVFLRTLDVIDRYRPTEMCLESQFYGKNVQSMIKLGRAQGVAMAAGLYRQLPIAEYAPLKIKMAITGNGRASKEQVADMLRRMLYIDTDRMPAKLDATDALAVALCHYLQTSNPLLLKTKGARNWKDFVSQNKSRVVGSVPASFTDKQAALIRLTKKNS
ncbi:MAG: crossover junction endodeoxyribonuclease RuvC [Paludibacteraceae bacterium]|nr:crossover junction endodeoxyribonuclease RuvC [Paludibacteraceae bacterium]